VTPTLDLVLPGDPDTRTGGYAYDRRIAAGLRELGWSVRMHSLAASFPAPDRAALADAAAQFAMLPDDALVLVDGLAFGALPDVAAREAARLRLVALVHHPLALESGLDAATRARLRASETAALAHVRAVVATSERTARDLADWGVARKRIVVVEPGTDRAPLARGSALASASASPSASAPAFAPGTMPGMRPVRMLCVATLTPRKGHDLLLDALASLTAHAWRLDCVGSADRSPPTAMSLRAQAARLGLDERIDWRGELPDDVLATMFVAADLFVLPARHEGYGMAVAEALARGLPVVATRTGATPELVGDHAGLLVPPDDVPALTEALDSMLADPATRARHAAGAARVRERLPTWPDACAALDRALRAIPARVASA
jgi:glycosyltransferase involved in cell wall biosynthesis